MQDDGSRIRHADYLDIEVAYARFNARKTVAFATESRFETKRMGPLTLTWDLAREPHSYYHRVLGLDAAHVSTLDDALALYESLGLRARIDVSEANDSPELRSCLEEREYQATEKLTYLCSRPRTCESGRLSIERWGPERADDFLDLLAANGGEVDGKTRELRRPYLCTDQFRVFTVSFEGRPRAWATLFVEGRTGFLGNAYTFEDARGQGAQLELFRRRLDEAATLGLDWVITDVEPNTVSERNAKRAGLDVFTVEEVWERPRLE